MISMVNEMHPVTQYATDVVYGDARANCCAWEIAACKRHLDDLGRVGNDDFPYVFDETRADRIIRHYEGLRRIDDPSSLIVMEDWQKFDKGCIFGWVHKDTGERRFKIAYTRIARGQAKTTDAAGVGTYAMCGDALYPPFHPELAKYEFEPIVAVVAVDRQQGKDTCWGDIWKMAAANPQLKSRLDIKKTYIHHRTRGGDVRLYSKDTQNKSGDKPSVIIVEEWHEHKTSAVKDRATSGLGKKWQALEYTITTAGTDAENKPCYKDDIFYKRILSGEVKNDRIFVMIREIDDTDNPHDIECWKKANPFFRAMGDYARRLFDQVKSEHDIAYGSGDASKIREFLIMRMNRWQTDSENNFFSGCMEAWEKCKVSRKEFAELTRDTKGFYGFDLGKTLDLSGAGYVANIPDGRIAISMHGFMPQNRAIEHEHSDRVPYKDWAADGGVTLTPGDVTDNLYVEQWIYEHEDDFGWKCQMVGYDGHNAIDMAIRMRDRYNNEDKVVEIQQTAAALNQATKRFRELVLQGKVVHDGSPLARWCLANAIEAKNTYGDIKLSKRHKDDSQRIDPLAATINALVCLIKNEDTASVYEERGMRIL